MTSVYVLLGADGSGRHEILADLVLNGAAAGGSDAPKGGVRVYLPVARDDSAETEVAAAASTSAFPPSVEVRRWGTTGGRFFMDAPETAPETVFILTDGRANPVDQIELIAAVLPRLGWQVARILTVVNCSLLATRPELTEWFNACIHFSDVALLSRRENVSNAWVAKFISGYKEGERMPCLFELVHKRGRVENPARILVPEARRLSMIFDDTDGLDEMEFDGDNLPEEPFDIKPGTDPWFERAPNGERRRLIPDIREFLPPVSPPVTPSAPVIPPLAEMSAFSPSAK